MRTYKGKLYWQNIDDQSDRGLIGPFAVQARSRIAATEQILDQLWDDRLDSASCSPFFEWEQDDEPRVAASVSADEALVIAKELSAALTDGNPTLTPATYHTAVAKVERKHGIGSVALAALWIIPMRESLDALVNKPKEVGEALDIAMDLSAARQSVASVR